MNTTHIGKNFRTAALGAAIAGMAAPALLFLGAGTAQAIQDVSEVLVAPPLVQDVSDAFITPPLVQDVSERVPGVTVGAFNPDTPGVIDPGSTVGIGGPDTRPSIIDPDNKVGILDPGSKIGLGGPDTRPAP